MPRNYPYLQGDRLVGLRLDNDLELSSGTVPPSGAGGGAGQFKLWMATGGPPPGPSLRMATAARATAGSYVASEWATLGTLNIAGNTFSFQGGWNGDLTTTGNLYLGGPSIHFNGSISAGPNIQADTNFAFRLGPSGGAYLWFDQNVTTMASLTNTGFSVSGNLTASGSLYLSGQSAFFFGASSAGPNISADGTNMSLRPGSGNGSLIITSSSGTPTALVSFASGNITCGNYLYLNSSNGNVNSVGGPFLFGDANYVQIQLGVNNAGFAVHDHSGFERFFVSGVGILALNGKTVLSGDANYNVVYDASQRQCLLLGSTANNTNMYRADTHVFETNAATPLGQWTSAVLASNTPISSGQNIGTQLDLIAGRDVTAGRNMNVTNDIAAQGVFRRTIGGSKGARVECWAGDWDSMQFGMTTGHLSVSPDGGTSGFIFNSDSSYSDVRLKDNIRDTDVDALEILRQTPVRAFEWNAKGRELMPWASPVECGLVAQELEETIPVATGTAPFADEPMYINNQNLTPYIIRAIQQIADRLDAIIRAIQQIADRLDAGGL
jgi:hypothetical protein